MLQFRSKKYQEKMKNVMLSDDILKEGELFLRQICQNQSKEKDFWQKWETAEDAEKKYLAQETYGENWQQLIKVYAESTILRKGQILEVLGYIKKEEVAIFLLNELKNADESLSLACATALKKQDPLMILEPILESIRDPQNFAVARIFDILADIGPLLVPYILQRLPSAGQKSKVVMIQLLGEFGDESVAEALMPLAESEDYALRKALAEALGKIPSLKAQEMLLELLKDKNWQIRLLCGEALKKYANIRDLPEIKEAYIKEQDKVVKAILAEVVEMQGDIRVQEPAEWKRIG